MEGKHEIILGELVISIDHDVDIWQARDQIGKQLIEQLSCSLSGFNDVEMKFEIVNVSPGCIKYTIKWTAIVLGGVAAAFSIADSTKANELFDKLAESIPSISITVDYASKKCQVSLLRLSPTKVIYGPINNGETLSEIANQIKVVHFPKSNHTINQIMAGLYKQNSHAFYDGNINNLNEGACLALPKSHKYDSIDSSNRLVNEHNQSWR